MPANPFPISAPPFDGRSRAVGVGAVFAWLRLGWNLFMINPGLWIASAAILVIGFLALMIVPLIGQLLACLLTPVLIAGLFAMCRKAAGEGAPRLSDLAVGFTTQTAPLMMLGVIFMVAAFSIEVVVILLFSGSMLGSLTMPSAAGLTLFLISGSLLVLLLSSLLFIPLWMAMMFAPALILFNGMPPMEACKASFWANLKNILPFLILGLIGFVLCFFAALPIFLGFLVLIPVLAGTAYAAYQDVFVAH
jgi:uncharacterized membrane protein